VDAAAANADNGSAWLLPVNPHQNAISNDEASGTPNNISALSEEREAASAHFLPTSDEGTAEDDDDNAQDTNFLGFDDLEEQAQGNDDGDEDIDDTLVATHVDGVEEDDDLPWDKASCAEDLLSPQLAPCYNL